MVPVYNGAVFVIDLPAWAKTCGSDSRLTSRTFVQPNSGTQIGDTNRYPINGTQIKSVLSV